MPAAELPKQFDAFLLELPYPGRPSGGKHVAVVLSTDRFQAATGHVLVAGLIHPKGHQRYPSHVFVSRHLFTPTGGGRPLPEDRVVQLDQARTLPAPPRSERIGAMTDGLWDGRACEDGYGLETAFTVHFQIEGYLDRTARYGRPMRPVEVPGCAYPRSSVWLSDGKAGRRLVIVSNETYNEISDFVQALEIAVMAEAGSGGIPVQTSGAARGPQPGYLLPALRSVEKRRLQRVGQFATSDQDKLDRCLLDMIGA